MEDQTRTSFRREPGKISSAFFKTLSFDLETYSRIETRMPNANDESDCIFQIGCSLNIENQPTKTREVLFTLSKQKFKLKNCEEVFVFQDEASLLKAFIQFVIDENPVFLTDLIYWVLIFLISRRDVIVFI